jgi:hypothetical protein
MLDYNRVRIKDVSFWVIGNDVRIIIEFLIILSLKQQSIQNLKQYEN